MQLYHISHFAIALYSIQKTYLCFSASDLRIIRIENAKRKHIPQKSNHDENVLNNLIYCHYVIILNIVLSFFRLDAGVPNR
uniref:Uncharacterized protein n=1 Tax=Anguilla anguilla TaxID=7936 RepID=A0A0E9XKP0_ANGAN